MHPPDSSILIVDPHPIFGDGMASVISRFIPDAEVLVCADFTKAAELIRLKAVDLIITDFKIDGRNAPDLLGELAAASTPTKCLILSSREELQVGCACIRAGATGFVGRSAPVAQIIVAIRLILSGHSYLSESLTSALVNGHKVAAPDSPSTRLTARELQVFYLLGQCHSVSTIAAKLGLSAKTIEAHREHIKNKLGCQNAAEVIAAAIRWSEESCFSI